MAIRQWPNNAFVFTKCWVHNTNVGWSDNSVNDVRGTANWWSCVGWSRVSDNGVRVSDNGVRGTANWSGSVRWSDNSDHCVRGTANGWSSVGWSDNSDNCVRGTANWRDSFCWSNDSDNGVLGWSNDSDNGVLGWSNDSDNDIHGFNDHDYVAFILYTSASISVGRWHLPLDSAAVVLRKTSATAVVE